MLGDARRLDGQRAELVDRAGQHFVAGPLSIGKLSPVRALASTADRPSTTTPSTGTSARLDDDAVADLQFAGEDAHFLAVAEAASSGAGRPRPILRMARCVRLEGDRFQALADHADEDDLGGDERFADEDGGHAGDGQGQVGADRPSSRLSSEPYRMRAPPITAASNAIRYWTP